MKYSTLRIAVYWVLIVLNIGVVTLGITSIVIELGQEINPTLFRKYYLGSGIGLGIVYASATFFVTLLGLIFFKKNYFRRLLLVCFGANALFGVGYYFLITLLYFDYD